MFTGVNIPVMFGIPSSWDDPMQLDHGSIIIFPINVAGMSCIAIFRDPDREVKRFQDEQDSASKRGDIGVI